MKAIGVIIGIFISMPIWFYLLHTVLVAIDASELSWFLYYAYLPASVVGALILNLAEKG